MSKICGVGCLNASNDYHPMKINEFGISEASFEKCVALNLKLTGGSTSSACQVVVRTTYLYMYSIAVSTEKKNTVIINYPEGEKTSSIPMNLISKK